jgi:predicted PurR-regulated permease PerM
VSGLGRRDLHRAIALAFGLAVVYRYLEQIARIALLAYAAAIVAVALEPIARRAPLPRRWVAAGIGIAVLIVIGVAFAVLGPIVLRQIAGTIEHAPETLERLEDYVARVDRETGLPARAFFERAVAAGGEVGRELLAPRMLGHARGALEVFVVPLILLGGGLYAVARPHRGLLAPAYDLLGPRAVAIGERLAVRLRGWVRGTLVAMAATGSLATIALLLIGVPNAFALGALITIAELVPIVGPWVGALPAILVALAADPTKALWVTVAMLAIQQLESTVITPWAMSNQADVHPVVTLFAILLFGALFGLLGVILAVPLVLLARTVVEVLRLPVESVTAEARAKDSRGADR